MSDSVYTRFPDRDARNQRQERLELPLMTRALRLPRHGDVLEVGCGRANALPGMSRLLEPRTLVGLDIDCSLLQVAQVRMSGSRVRCELVAGDVRSMPFVDESFDVIVDFGTLFHIGAPELALRDIARVLRPGGLFVHETMASQKLSHPFLSRGRRVPWELEPRLRVLRRAVLWSARERVD